MLESPYLLFQRSVLQYLRQLTLFTVNHDHRRLLLIVSIVIARPQHADMKYWMELVGAVQLVVHIAWSSKDLQSASILRAPTALSVMCLLLKLVALHKSYQRWVHWPGLRVQLRYECVLSIVI